MKRRIWTIAFLVIVVCVSTAMLNAVYMYTEPAVHRNERIKVQKGVLEVFHISYEKTSIEGIFEASVDTWAIENKVYYSSRAGDVAFEVSGPGLWGDISAMIALDADLETIKGFRVLRNTETPGLGGRITEDWFQDQFIGKKVVPELKIVPHGKAKRVNEVDAITGATQTSKALEKIIDKEIKAFRLIMRK